MKTLKNGLDRFLAFVCIVDFIVFPLPFAGGQFLRSVCFYSQDGQVDPGADGNAACG